MAFHWRRLLTVRSVVVHIPVETFTSPWSLIKIMFHHRLSLHHTHFLTCVNVFSFMLPGIRILTVPCDTHCNLECCQHRAVVHSMTARTCRASDLSICLLLPFTDFVQILRDRTTTYTLRLLPQAAKLTEAEVGKNIYWLARIAMKFTWIEPRTDCKSLQA